jgi:hypothetical protein
MGLNAWVLVLLSIALSGVVGYLVGQNRVWKNSSERIYTLKRAYEERLRATPFGTSGSRPSLPPASPSRLGTAMRTASSSPGMQSPA